MEDSRSALLQAIEMGQVGSVVENSRSALLQAIENVCIFGRN